MEIVKSSWHLTNLLLLLIPLCPRLISSKASHSLIFLTLALAIPTLWMLIPWQLWCMVTQGRRRRRNTLLLKLSASWLRLSRFVRLNFEKNMRTLLKLCLLVRFIHVSLYSYRSFDMWFSYWVSRFHSFPQSNSITSNNTTTITFPVTWAKRTPLTSHKPSTSCLCERSSRSRLQFEHHNIRYALLMKVCFNARLLPQEHRVCFSWPGDSTVEDKVNTMWLLRPSSARPGLIEPIYTPSWNISHNCDLFHSVWRVVSDKDSIYWREELK